MTDSPITDFHLHLFARPFFESLAQQSPLPGTCEEKIQAAAERAGIELPPSDARAHLERWIGELDANGVRRAAAFASAPEEIPAVAEMAARSNGRLVPIAVCNPVAPGAADRLRPLMETKGFRGVLLFPAMHHYHLSDAAVQPVLQLLEEHRGIAYVHCGLLVIKLRDLLGLPRPYDLRFANPLEVIPAACRHGDVTFCIPHFGAGFFRETLIAGAQCANVVTDTSSSHSWTSTQPDAPSLTAVLGRALDVFGTERVVFDTDSNVFPGGWRRERYDVWVDVADDLGLTGPERLALFHGNAARLLDRVRDHAGGREAAAHA